MFALLNLKKKKEREREREKEKCSIVRDHSVRMSLNQFRCSTRVSTRSGYTIHPVLFHTGNTDVCTKNLLNGEFRLNYRSAD